MIFIDNKCITAFSTSSINFSDILSEQQSFHKHLNTQLYSSLTVTLTQINNKIISQGNYYFEIYSVHCWFTSKSIMVMYVCIAILICFIGFLMKMLISNLVRMIRFWNTLHQVCIKSKDWKAKLF